MSALTTCTLAGCGRRDKITRGMCQMHYQRAKRAGTVSTLPRVKRIPGTTVPCLVDGCVSDVLARGYCGKHYERWSKHGDPSIVGIASSCAIKGDVPTYSTMHHRLRRARGRAADHTCIDCGRPAREWSYDNADPDELHTTVANGSVVAYSLDLSHYQPRCTPCHRLFDAAHAAA